MHSKLPELMMLQLSNGPLTELLQRARHAPQVRQTQQYS